MANIGTGHAVVHEFRDQFIGHQRSGRDEFPGARTERVAGRYRSSQESTDIEVGDTENL